jgi:hypothetical protein
MTASVTAILEEIRQAFPAVRVETDFALIDSRQSDEPVLTEQAFANRFDWTTLQSDWLDDAPDGWSSALSWLTDEALCFFIPAYLCADLTGGLKRADVVYHLVAGFDDLTRETYVWMDESQSMNHHAQKRWKGLSWQQAAAIVHYLEWKIEQVGPVDGHEMIEALKAYWYERAGRP